MNECNQIEERPLSVPDDPLMIEIDQEINSSI